MAKTLCIRRMIRCWRRRPLKYLGCVTLWHALALLLACDYLAFRIEPFGDEYESAHPNVDLFSRHQTLTCSTLNWETFDKDNAPKAFQIVVDPPLERVIGIIMDSAYRAPDFAVFFPIRDKSPPVLSA
jgi:hypothetical protein